MRVFCSVNGRKQMANKIKTNNNEITIFFIQVYKVSKCKSKKKRRLYTC